MRPIGPRLALLLALGSANGACIVTGEHEFEQEQSVPPAVVDVSDADFQIADRIRWSPPEGVLTFEVLVRDPNVDDELFARWRRLGTRPEDNRLLSTCNPETGADPEIPRTATAERPFSFSISAGEVEEGCFRLELAVSDQFQNTCDEVNRVPGVFAFTRPLGNVGIARWQLIVDDPNTPIEPTCPEIIVSEVQATQ